jgi:hypothetical protein
VGGSTAVGRQRLEAGRHGQRGWSGATAADRRAPATARGGTGRESRLLTRGLRPQYRRRGQPCLNKNMNSNSSKQIQTIPNFGLSEKYLPIFGKIKIKYDFEDLKEMNNSPHRNLLRFGVYLELKFSEISMLEFDRI